MIRSPGQILRKVLLCVCFIQVVVTIYLAFCIYNSAFSTLNGMKSLPKLEIKQRNIPPKEGHQKVILGVLSVLFKGVCGAYINTAVSNM